MELYDDRRAELFSIGSELAAKAETTFFVMNKMKRQVGEVDNHDKKRIRRYILDIGVDDVSFLRKSMIIKA